MKIRLTKAAIRDLIEVEAYIALDNPRAAFGVKSKIDRAITLISERPGIGRPASGGASREWSIPGLPYLIPYRISGDVIDIIRIWHTSRQRPTEW
ncbi:type II toxin-antitoxin system RelE/ParE family toxin [Mesorhizobium sp. IMUNJ 23232]|uniref:type II toxin-antitoxin system RelE/ParE family toxin n=1 Tax=Mesorhizobium sp. IMUNJ 23232 TaxID=3376064 RepID=UPI0037932B04